MTLNFFECNEKLLQERINSLVDEYHTIAEPKRRNDILEELLRICDGLDRVVTVQGHE